MGSVKFSLYKEGEVLYEDTPLSIGLDLKEHAGSKEYDISMYDYDRIDVKTTGSSATNGQDGHGSMTLS